MKGIDSAKPSYYPVPTGNRRGRHITLDRQNTPAIVSGLNLKGGM